jgi:uncharacterized protein YndB with AHSA1/START domain
MGRTFRVSGNYVTLERPHRVAFTWSCSTWPDPAIQSVVTVTIEPDGAEASIMTIEHRLLPAALVQQHRAGPLSRRNSNRASALLQAAAGRWGHAGGQTGEG